jgi:two-component system, OmpR family, sensor kinase
VLVLAIVALEVPLASSVADRVDAEVRSQARAQADLVAATVADLLGPSARRQRERVVDVIAANTRGRVIVVDRRGRLLADSEETPIGRDYSGRPEIAAALANRRDQRERASQSLGQTLLATSVPILRNGRPAGAVRITQSVDAVDRAVRRAWLGLALIGAAVLGMGLLAGSLIARQITRPLRRLDRAAERVADGDLGTRATVEGSAEQRSLARTFNVMTQRLERMVGSQTEFVADASHQLRTPLTGIRLRLEAVQAGRLEPDAAADVDVALNELDRMAEMISELLELSRAGERDAAGEHLDLADIVEGAAERWRATAAERRQTLTATIDDPGRVVWMARPDADRIVDVLIENALHYSPDGSEVEIATSAGGIEVRDRGPGVDPGEVDAVFERFHRGRAGRQGPAGSGLGLPIARELARRWSADVMLRPRPAGGAIAELRLVAPRAGSSAKTPEGLGKDLASDASGPGLGGVR